MTRQCMLSSVRQWWSIEQHEMKKLNKSGKTGPSCGNGLTLTASPSIDENRPEDLPFKRTGEIELKIQTELWPTGVGDCYRMYNEHKHSISSTAHRSTMQSNTYGRTWLKGKEFENYPRLLKRFIVCPAMKFVFSLMVRTDEIFFHS